MSALAPPTARALRRGVVRGVVVALLLAALLPRGDWVFAFAAWVAVPCALLEAHLTERSWSPEHRRGIVLLAWGLVYLATLAAPLQAVHVSALLGGATFEKSVVATLEAARDLLPLGARAPTGALDPRATFAAAAVTAAAAGALLELRSPPELLPRGWLGDARGRAVERAMLVLFVLLVPGGLLATAVAVRVPSDGPGWIVVGIVVYALAPLLVGLLALALRVADALDARVASREEAITTEAA